MSFYEFKEPYYALIKSHTPSSIHQNNSVRIYEENVSKLEGAIDTIKVKNAKAREVWNDEAFFIFSRTEDNLNKSYQELKSEFAEIQMDTIVVLDSSLS